VHVSRKTASFLKLLEKSTDFNNFWSATFWRNLASIKLLTSPIQTVAACTTAGSAKSDLSTTLSSNFIQQLIFQTFPKYSSF